MAHTYALLKSHAHAYLMRRPHRSFKKTEHVKLQLGGALLPPVSHTLRSSLALIWQNKKLFLGLTTLYAVITYIFVGGVSQIDFVALREASIDVMGGELGEFGTLLSVFGGTLSGAVAEPPTQIQQFIGSLLGFLFWLAVIWAARMRVAGEAIGIRDTLYNFATPLISSFVVFLAAMVQALPAMLSLFAFAILQASGMLNGPGYSIIAVVIVILCCLLSAYWLAGSLMALVAVTLPQMYPWRALSAASELVIGQRWRLALHIGVMILAVMAVWVLVMFPLLVLDGWLRFDWLPLIPVVVQALVALSALYSSVFMYRVYRNLL